MALHSALTRSFSINTLLGLALLLVVYHWPTSHTEPANTRSSRNEIAARSVLENNVLATPSQNSSSLMRRDDYTCGSGKPCANGACCGPSGYCGYGSTYCGTGCVSNCNAVAECGKDASPSGKTCPLNTCCSQYGFCGTTQDFCTTKCQSNCVLHPTPPGSGGGNILQKVIGYYESWSARLPCHQVAPSDLPLDALTHLNYAFAYIDPSTFQIVTMDSQTPEQLFQEVAGVKQFKSTIKVWVSVGGWTFSDNGTATQPVYGNIAASAANRQLFANNVVKFLNHYGFDGIDIDWEYPGAPDRGGHKEDTANFVLLLQTLRSTFDQNPRGLGISFTAPSSYWYLRWFDLPGLLKYADWINLMTYDLHGTWDRNNPIGSIVQGHTNLTEIALATELLCCTTPECQFSGGASPGPCSDTSGILMYYEIMALLKQHPELTPTWDKTAAVKYVTYNGNQWVSYDDADTFKQKVDWANKQGLGGALIWASDTDDDKYSAHTGLVGKTLGHIDSSSNSKAVINVDAGAIAQNLIGQNGQNCVISTDCTDQNNPQASGCGNGKTHVGTEKGNCGRNYAHSICCPSATAPNNCIWRGSGGDCNGQCHPGEATIFGSSWGGTPTESNQNKCSRGYKVFCCDAGDWRDVIAGCHWTSCGGSCSSNEDQVSQKYDSGWCTVFNPIYTYCCPHPALLHDCRWVGSNPDCPDAKCASDEVSIDLNPQGSGYSSCSWGRKKTDCCKVKAQPPPSLTCSISLCDFDSGLCQISEDDAFGALKRSLSGDHPNFLEERGGSRRFPFELFGIGVIYRLSRSYPSRGDVFAGAGLNDVIRRWWQMRFPRCEDSRVVGVQLDLSNPPNSLPTTAQTEHPIDLSMHSRFVQVANTGRLASGGLTRTPAIASSFFRDTYFSDNAIPPNTLPRVTGLSPDFTSPSTRVYEAFGSYTNRGNLILTEAQINGAKGRLFTLTAPVSVNTFRSLVQLGAAGNETAVLSFLQELRVAVGVFQYLQDPFVNTRFQATRNLIGEQFQILESTLPGGTGLTQHWNEFFPDYLQQIEDFAQTWMTDRIDDVRRIYNSQAGMASEERASVLLALINLERQIADMKIPRQ